MSTATDFHDTTNGTAPAPAVSPETVRFLLALLDSLTISMGAPDAEQQFAAIVKARSELRSLC